MVQEDAAGAGGGGRGSGGGIASWGEDDAYLRSGEARTQNALPVWVLRWTVFFLPKILYAMQNGFGSPDACFVGDSLRVDKSYHYYAKTVNYFKFSTV